MTQTLKGLMEAKADLQAAPHFDVADIAAAGDARRRRRRAGGALAAVATVALGAVVLPGLLGGVGSDTEGLVADDGGSGPDGGARRVGYAVGHVIHDGTDTIDVGRRIVSYVQNDDGFVYATGNGDVWLHAGTVSERIGHSENQRLRADDRGSLVAWVDRAEDGAPRYVVYDTAAHVEVARVDDDAAGPSRDPGDEGAEVFAVDAGAAYWRTTDGLVRYEVASGETQVLSPSRPVTDPAHKPDRPTRIVDVADGVLAYLVEGEQGSRMMVGREIGETAVPMPTGWNGTLSPDGRHLGVEEEDRLAVYATATGTEVTPDLERYPFKVLYGWVDEDTAMVFAIRRLDGGYPADFLACDVPEGSCEVVVSEDEVRGVPFALPVGDPMDT